MSKENLDLLMAAARESLGVVAESSEGIVLEYFLSRAYEEGGKDRRMGQYSAGSKSYETTKRM